MVGTGRRGSTGERIFRWLLRAYPRRFRRAFETELLAFFRQDRQRARRRGVLALAAFWTRTLVDLTRSALRQRTRPLADIPARDHAPRERSPMNGLLSDLRVALRGLRRSPGFFAVAVAALALGIGATTATWSVVDGVLVRSLPYPEAERLVQVGTAQKHDPDRFGRVDGGDFLDVRASIRTLDAVVASFSESRTLLGRDRPRLVSVAEVTGGFFDVLGGHAMVGRTLVRDDFTADADRTVVLAHSLWRSAWGGDPGVVGRSIELDGEAYVVVGVMDEGFRPPEALWTQRNVEAWTALHFRPDVQSRRGAFQYEVIGRLDDGATVATARAELEALFDSLSREYYAGNVVGAHVESLEARTVGDAGSALGLVLAATLLLLLIACANVANLLLVRAGDRQREIAVRSALGASRGRIARQLFTESMLLAALGGTGGALLAYWGVELFRGTNPGDIPRLAEVTVDARVLAFAVALSTVTGLLFGVVPALTVSYTRAAEALKDSATTTAGRARVWSRSALVVTQTALSFVLLVSAVLLAHSFVRLATVDPGFDPDGLMVVEVGATGDRQAWAPFHERLLERVHGIPGVRTASLTSTLPYSGAGIRFAMTPEGWDPVTRGSESAFVSTISTSPGHLENLRVPLVAGRWLTEVDRPGGPCFVLVNQAFVEEFWPDTDPGDGSAVGRQIETIWRCPGTGEGRVAVGGVVGDVRHTPDREPRPELYVPLRQSSSRRMSVIARTDRDPSTLAPAMRQAVWEIDPDLPIRQLATMDEIMAGAITGPRFYTLLLGTFATVALLVALVGVYGTVAYAAVQRTRELGIRLALGARRGAAVSLLVRGGLRLVTVGVLLGALGSLAATRLLDSFLFGIGATDPWSFLLAAVLFVAAAAVAGYLPARRAARLDPVSVLRSE